MGSGSGVFALSGSGGGSRGGSWSKGVWLSAWQRVIGLSPMPLHNRARPAPTLDERMGRGTFPPQGGGGKRQEASPATGNKARRKVFGMSV